MGQKEKVELISRIVDTEWEMFHNTPNIGGKSPCQEDRRTFENNRNAQAMSWSEATLKSYSKDLSEAMASGRNLVAEKYAHMMASTWPEEYTKIKHLLLPPDPEVLQLIEEIIIVLIKWEVNNREQYPDIARRSRPLYSTEDSNYVTSFETYYRGELTTYSRETLRLYYDDIVKLLAENINGLEVALEHLMRGFGFKSLEEANTTLHSR
jgi:hypothetical protein